MKINKILAAGIAATLAVTSLSAVVSAETKTREFDMSQSAGRWVTVKGTYTSVYGSQTAADRAYATASNRAVVAFSVAGTAALYKNTSGDYMLEVTNPNGVETYYTQMKGLKAADAANTKPATWNNGAKDTELVWQFDLADAWWSGAQVTVNGYKYNEDGSKTKVSQTAKADSKGATGKQSIGANKYELVVLPDTVLTYKEGTAIAPAYFDEIESVGVSLTFNNKPIGWYKPDTDATDGVYDGISAYTTNENNFKYMEMLLKKIVLPVSDATTTYYIPATNEIDKNADADGATKGDGIETYTITEANNKAIVEAQKALVGVTPALAAQYAEAKAYKKCTVTKIADGTSVDLYTPAALGAGAAQTAQNFWALDKAFAANAGDAAATHYIAGTGANAGKILIGDNTVAADGTGAVYSIATTATAVDRYVAENDKEYMSAVTLTANDLLNEPFKSGKTIGNNAFAAAMTIVKVSEATPEKAVGGNTAAAVISYCIAHGGFDPAKALAYTRGFTPEVATDNGTRYAYLQRTTKETTIKRHDVDVLSSAAAYYASNGGDLGGTDDNQSYKEDIYNKGDNPNQFAGLASQVADFFNKQNNGKITLHFVSPSAASSGWVYGGVPSTEVGLKNSLAGASFGLFVNYAQSTGSLQTIGVVDADACTVTFDIAEVLNDMGGFTKGNISDLYYGLNKGERYAEYSEEDGYDVGYLVDKVTLTYDDAAAAVDATADDDAAVVVADDDDDDDVFADDDVIADDDDDDDDDDAGIIEDDDDDDADVNNDVDYVDGDDDANPGTGVGLAVIPAIVAAAAAIVSKKRK